MKQIIYTKYNRIRRPEFATRTAIIRDAGGICRVEKKALYPEGEKHIRSFADKAALMRRLYRNVQVVDASYEEDGVSFPFVAGSCVGRVMENHLSDKGELFKHLEAFLEETMDYADDMRIPFAATKEFTKVFGETDYQGKAVAIANIDGIPDNFLRDENGLMLIDYEWVFDFPVPEPFICFRCLYYFLAKNHSIITGLLSEDDYFAHFGFSREDRKRWEEMDSRFQEYVHGQGQCCNYPVSFLQTIHDINYLLNHVNDVGGERHNLVLENRKLSRQLSELRSIRNFLRYKIEEKLKR